jgi:hypothetical protein
MDFSRDARRVALALTVVACAGCPEGDESAGPVDDGKYHPAPNGVHVSEDEACATVMGAFQDRALALGCTTTVRPCPNFLRAQYSTACMEYDEGTVLGCAQYFGERAACSEMLDDVCVLEPFPGTEPAGCP